MLYRTIDHDTWDHIAFRLCIDREKGISRIMEANSRYANTVFFSAGIIITIPEDIYEIAIDGPPWRR